MAVTLDEIIAKYIELRDRKAEMAKKHADEMAPINEAMGTIENYLMHKMNEMGCDSIKANGVGTAFKANQVSCQMADAVAFKEFVFHPAAAAVFNHLVVSGYISEESVNADEFVSLISNNMRDLARWDVVDFRAGKKGIQEYVANENAPVPGVSINTTAVINVRRA